MEVNQDESNIWTSVYIPGEESWTDAQIIESTPESSDDEQGPLEEDDCLLYLCPSQQSLPLMEEEVTTMEDQATGAEDGDVTKEAEDTGSSTTRETSLLMEGISVACQTTSGTSCPPDLQTPDAEETTTEICQGYKVGTCKYGVDGTNCLFSHPAACRKLLRYGQWGFNGCNLGTTCKLFHPLCRTSLTQNFCKRGTKCKFEHPRGWKVIVGDVSKLTQ